MARDLCEEKATLRPCYLQTVFQAKGAGPRHFANSEARGYFASMSVSFCNAHTRGVGRWDLMDSLRAACVGQQLTYTHAATFWQS
jgi:hypothetical protein